MAIHRPPRLTRVVPALRWCSLGALPGKASRQRPIWSAPRKPKTDGVSASASPSGWPQRHPHSRRLTISACRRPFSAFEGTASVSAAVQLPW